MEEVNHPPRPRRTLQQALGTGAKNVLAALMHAKADAGDKNAIRLLQQYHVPDPRKTK
jgi:hypothetical protein